MRKTIQIAVSIAAGALVLWMLFPSIPAGALSKPAVGMDSWRTSCTADGGTPNEIIDEVDGGDHTTASYAAFHVSNESTTCVNVGSTGGSSTDPVDVNTGIEIGDGCAAGKVWAPDIRPAGIGCTSQGAAALIRVSVVKE
jgi:hypothetical protein